MTPVSLLVAALFCALAAISARRIAALRVSRDVRVLLLGLRLLLLALLALAFIEPTFVFERFTRNGSAVPVLIDVSKSMGLFSNDSSITRLLGSAARWNAAHARGSASFVSYCFGDSFRRCDLRAPPSFSDRRSFFPEALTEKIPGDAPSILLVSDGNWSNAAPPSGVLAEKNVLYLPLGKPRPFPSLRMEITKASPESIADSPFTATAVLEGTASSAGRVSVSVKERDRRLFERSVPVPAGVFSLPVNVSLAARVPGVHCYRFEALLAPDSLTCSRYVVRNALPGTFSWSACGAAASLDRRFLLSALRNRGDFSEVPDAKKTPLDLLVVFEGYEGTGAMAQRVKPRGALLFAGCAPCGSPAPLPAASARLLLPFFPAAQNPFDGCDIASLPPPQRLSICGDAGPRPRAVFLNAVLPGGDPRVPDTAPVVYTGRLPAGARSVGFAACAASGIWRWDFWPLSATSGEERASVFSNRLIDLAKNVLAAGLSDDLFLYPAGDLAESDFLRFWALLPAECPVESGLRMSCSFEGRGAARIDTTFTVHAVSAARQLRFAPLPAGAYRFEARASGGGRHYTFSDSIVVDADRSEYTAPGQNVTLLQEMGQPLTDCSADGLEAAFFRAAPEKGSRVKTVVHVSRNWPLLMAIFLVLAVEWLCRRRFRLD